MNTSTDVVGPGEEPSMRDAALSQAHVVVAQLFFALDASRGFLLAGGAALVARGMTTRATRDLAPFTAPGSGDVTRARDALEAAVASRGWVSRRARDGESFVRLVVTVQDRPSSGSVEDVVVDLAVDAAPVLLSTTSVVGPTLAPDDLVARKLVALFDRAEARDFADVYLLSARYSRQRSLELAVEADRGFDRAVFADMLGSLVR